MATSLRMQAHGVGAGVRARTAGGNFLAGSSALAMNKDNPTPGSSLKPSSGPLPSSSPSPSPINATPNSRRGSHGSNKGQPNQNSNPLYLPLERVTEAARAATAELEEELDTVRVQLKTLRHAVEWDREPLNSPKYRGHAFDRRMAAEKEARRRALETIEENRRKYRAELKREYAPLLAEEIQRIRVLFAKWPERTRRRYEAMRRHNFDKRIDIELKRRTMQEWTLHKIINEETRRIRHEEREKYRLEIEERAKFEEQERLDREKAKSRSTLHQLLQRHNSERGQRGTGMGAQGDKSDNTKDEDEGEGANEDVVMIEVGNGLGGFGKNQGRGTFRRRKKGPITYSKSDKDKGKNGLGLGNRSAPSVSSTSASSSTPASTSVTSQPSTSTSNPPPAAPAAAPTPASMFKTGWSMDSRVDLFDGDSPSASPSAPTSTQNPVSVTVTPSK